MNITRRTLLKTGAASAAVIHGFPAIAQGRTKVKVGYLHTPAVDGLREMGSGAQMLVDLGVRQLRLMTNNPRKIVGLEGYGLVVAERVPLTIPVSADNASFLRTQRLELGHLIPNLPL